MRIFLIISWLITYSLVECKKISLENLDYEDYPKRVSNEAAIVEWGNSAILSAVDAVVAKFGEKTEHDAFFEVETSLVLAIPLDGGDGIDKLENLEEVRGNMVIMANNGKLSGVGMAKLAQNSGAAGLMVVNTEDGKNSEHIYSMEVLPEEEEIAKEIDIPVIMISLNSGNLIAGGDDGNSGLPDRIRLYSAIDRPFFEDVSSNPVVYLIHNFLTDEECDQLMKEAKGKTQPAQNNVLEDIDNKAKVQNVESVHLWKGLLKGSLGKALDEKIEQVTGFLAPHLSDFTVFKHVKGASYGPHYDSVEGNFQLATLTVFLNDVDEGGEIVYPRADPPVRIRPTKGLAVVHHNSQEENNLVDLESLNGELLTLQEKWTAKKFVYMYPLSQTRRLFLPVLAMPTGRLPWFIFDFHDFMFNKFGPDQGETYFHKFFIAAGILILFSFANMLISIASKNQKEIKTKKNQ